MPINNLKKKKSEEISHFDLSQKAKKRKVFSQKCIYWPYGKLQNWRQSQSLQELSQINLILHYGRNLHFFPGSIAFYFNQILMGILIFTNSFKKSSLALTP